MPESKNLESELEIEDSGLGYDTEKEKTQRRQKTNKVVPNCKELVKRCVSQSKPKYVLSWEKQFWWLTENSADSPFCKFCHCALGSRKSTLKLHEESEKHIRAWGVIDSKSQLKITDDKLRSAKLQISQAEA